MGESENDVCFVENGVLLSYLVHLPRICHYQKTGEIVFVGFDAFLQYLHSVAFGSGTGTDGGVPFQVFPFDDFGTQSRIFGFYHFDTRVLVQELPALHQGNRVRVHLGNVIPVLFGQANEAMRNA